MTIKEEITSAIVLYRETSFPFNYLRLNKSLNDLKNLFSFEILIPNDSMLLDNPLVLDYRNGHFDNFLIKRLLIENRKVVITINASSDILNNAIKILNDYLSSLHNSYKLEIAYMTFTTEIFSEFSFKYSEIFSRKLLKINKLISSADKNIKSVNPHGLLFKIIFNTPNELLANNIILAEKEFKFEKKLHTKDDENIYYSSLPLPSKEHIAVLNFIEELFQK